MWPEKSGPADGESKSRRQAGKRVVKIPELTEDVEDRIFSKIRQALEEDEGSLSLEESKCPGQQLVARPRRRTS